jgi:hypothetical protein
MPDCKFGDVPLTEAQLFIAVLLQALKRCIYTLLKLLSASIIKSFTRELIAILVRKYYSVLYTLSFISASSSLSVSPSKRTKVTTTSIKIEQQ